MTIAKLNRMQRIDFVDDERDIGNGVIVTLKRGWTFDALTDNRVAGADTPSDAIYMVKNATEFFGPYDD